MTGDIHSAAADGYAVGAQAYTAGRPSYHPDIVNRLTPLFEGRRILDLGAGTGIATRAMVDRGLDVVAVEPVRAMREELARAMPQVDALDGGAEAIPVADETVGVVLVAQAFHWFDHGPALDEIARVLQPDGVLVTLWNVRDETVPWMAEWTRICDAHADDTPRYRTMVWRHAVEVDQRFTLTDEIHTPNPFPSSPDQAVQRALSTSFIAALDDESRQGVARAIRSLVEPLGETFPFPYRTEAQIWSRVG